MSLSNAVLKAQQALSDKYGIATFGTKGQISTVPSSGNLSPLARTVGVGAYTKESGSTFANTLQGIINQVKQTGGTVGQTLFFPPPTVAAGSTPPPSPGSQNNQTPNQPDMTKPTIGDSTISFLNNFKDFIGPKGVLVGVALVGLFLVTRGRR